MGHGGMVRKCAAKAAASSGMTEGEISGITASPHLSISSASTAVIRLRLSSMAIDMSHAGGSGVAPLHTSANAGDSLRVFAAPARYTAGAMCTADVRPNPLFGDLDTLSARVLSDPDWPLMNPSLGQLCAHTHDILRSHASRSFQPELLRALAV